MAFRAIVTLAAALLAISPPQAHAEADRASARESALAAIEADAAFTLGHQPASLGWRWSHPFEDVSGSVSVFAISSREGAPTGQPTRPIFVARQVERVAGEPDAIRWADSDDCPALMRLMHEFEALQAPPTVIAGLTWPPRFPIIALHGTGWTIWSRSAQQEGRYPAYVEMSSNSGHIATWGQRSREALSECWSENPPVLSRAAARPMPPEGR